MYTYGNLTDDISYFRFNGAQVGDIGSSVLGNKIYYIKSGEGERKIIVTGGIHARENITALLVIRQAFALFGTKTPYTVYFVPMVNPDGAILIEKGAEGAREYADLVRSVNKSDDFSQWKANVRAVDLNVNFDARFATGKNNLRYPAPMGYVGEYPFSEPETAALKYFTLAIRPIFTISYHALGREVYWDFFRGDAREREFAHRVADTLGYKAVDGDMMSAGGYKDWCVQNGITALTIEVGSDEFRHPISQKDAEDDIMRNLFLPDTAYNIYVDIFDDKKRSALARTDK